MEISSNLHLTYCSNIHAGESWDEVFISLRKNIPLIKKSISPTQSFGIGLRLSADAAEILLTENHLDEFKKWLRENDCYVFTMNGFPFGNFHNAIVKDEVYKPDWTTNLRMEYTLDLINVLAELIPENSEAGISTSPLSFKPWIKDAKQLDFIMKSSCEHLMKCVEELFVLRQNTGKHIHLDLEPEPVCLLENSDETVFFFKNYLIPFGINYFNAKHAMSDIEAKQIILDHVQVCYDVCHFAVEFEEPELVIRKFLEAGIKIGKVQISSALKVITDNNTNRNEILIAYSKFAESTYMHQTIAKDSKAKLHYFSDLPLALEQFKDEKFVEWRTHYHVPIFMATYNELKSTQDDILLVLEILKKNKFTNHLEVETYTWEILPSEERLEIDESIIRELNWVKQCLGV